MRLFRQLRWAAFVVAMGLLTTLTSIAQEVQSGLRLSLSRVEQKSGRPLFRVKLENSGDRPLILNLGAMYGGQQYLNAIHLLLAEADGKILYLQLLEGGLIPGRIDPLIVPLPAGATFTFRVDLTKYISLKEKVWKLELGPGQYKLSAEYVGATVSQSQANLDMKGIALMPYWTGTVDSNVLPFTLTQPLGRQDGQ